MSVPRLYSSEKGRGTLTFIFLIINYNKFEYICSYNLTSLELVQECVDSANYNARMIVFVLQELLPT